VNGHFNTDNTQNGSAKKSLHHENGSVKLFKRNGKKIRFRRQPWSARMFDFIDSGIMEGLQHRLLSMTEQRTLGQFDTKLGDTVTLQSQIIARRTEQDGTKKVLLRWNPTDVVEDEWVTEKNYSRVKVVPIPSLAPMAKETLSRTLFTSSRTQQKHKRKPSKVT